MKVKEEQKTRHEGLGGNKKPAVRCRVPERTTGPSASDTERSLRSL